MKRQTIRGVDWHAVSAEASRRFGVTRFRPGQRELIECVLKAEDALGILPTGAGKSLCYQLPALFLQGAVVVVSPLIALMKDQHERLGEANIEAARLDSTLTDREQQRKEQQIRGGSQDVVLVTPERLRDPNHLEPLKRRGVALFVVDEAHCVSQWGHDFRPAYLELRHAIEALGNPPVLGLTATAPPDRLDDILQTLGIPHARVIQGGLERENLFLEVLRTVNSDEKRMRLTTILESEPGAGVVYAATVRAVNELHEWLRGLGIDVVRYHGQLRTADRETAQERFMSGDARLIVATNAFGLGVDKPDIRFVAHWNFPESIESYYQEAGRAGRDGKPARCSLFYRLEDKRVRSFFLGGKQPHNDDVRRFLDAVQTTQAQGATLAELRKASGLSDKRVSVISAGLEAVHVLVRDGRRRVRLSHTMSDSELTGFLETFARRRNADRERLHAMMRYGETTLCRMKYIREYFGEPPGDDCRHCDNCCNPEVQPTQVKGLIHGRARKRRAELTQKPPAFATGQTVKHSRFGTGTVVEVVGEELRIDFIRHGERRVLASYLRPL